LLKLQGHTIAALQLAAAADQARRRLNLQRSPWEEPRWRARLQALQDQLLPAQAEAALLCGREWETEEAVNAALASPAPVTVRA
jgi:sugar/nucleoside kinase (ribokinase family)